MPIIYEFLRVFGNKTHEKSTSLLLALQEDTLNDERQARSIKAHFSFGVERARKNQRNAFEANTGRNWNQAARSVNCRVSFGVGRFYELPRPARVGFRSVLKR